MKIFIIIYKIIVDFIEKYGNIIIRNVTEKVTENVSSIK